MSSDDVSELIDALEASGANFEVQGGDDKVVIILFDEDHNKIGQKVIFLTDWYGE